MVRGFSSPRKSEGYLIMIPILNHNNKIKQRNIYTRITILQKYYLILQTSPKIRCFTLTGIAQLVGRCPANHKVTNWRLDSWSGCMPGLQARPLVGGVQEATDQCFSPSLSPPFSLSLKINKMSEKKRSIPWLCLHRQSLSFQEMYYM